jgi:hypothetical protein
VLAGFIALTGEQIRRRLDRVFEVRADGTLALAPEKSKVLPV